LLTLQRASSPSHAGPVVSITGPRPWLLYPLAARASYFQTARHPRHRPTRPDPDLARLGPRPTRPRLSPTPTPTDLGLTRPDFWRPQTSRPRSLTHCHTTRAALHPTPTQGPRPEDPTSLTPDHGARQTNIGAGIRGGVLSRNLHLPIYNRRSSKRFVGRIYLSR